MTLRGSSLDMRTHAEQQDNEYEAQRTEEVHDRGTDGYAVVVGVEPEPEGSDRGVVGDDRREDRREEAGQETDAQHRAETRCRVAGHDRDQVRREPHQEEDREREQEVDPDVDEREPLGPRSGFDQTQVELRGEA